LASTIAPSAGSREEHDVAGFGRQELVSGEEKLGLLALGDVVRHAQDSDDPSFSILERDESRGAPCISTLKMQPLVVADRTALLDHATVETVHGRLHRRRVDVLRMLALDLRRAQAHESLPGRVVVDEAGEAVAVHVEQKDGVGGALEDLAVELLAVEENPLPVCAQ